MNEQPKPGIKTSEFWITVALIAIAAIAAMVPSDTMVGKIAAAILAAAAVFGYNVSRGLVKAANEKESGNLYTHVDITMFVQW